jgi:hypothetical protein
VLEAYGVSDLPPPSISPRAQPKRPVYLVVALLLVWVVGLFGATEGCQTIDVLHRPDAVRQENGRISDADMAKRREALIDTVLAFRKTVTPLAVGQLLLGSILTLSAGLTLLGRGQARKLAQQAIIIYALFLPADYLARRPMRAVAIDAIAEGYTFPPVQQGTSSPEILDQRVFFWWVYRGALGLQLFILGAGLFAMTRPRVRAFFAALQSDSAREQEP